MKYFYILLLAGFLSVGGFFGYKRWKHRYICIPPDAIWDVTCGHADDLKHAEPVDVGEFDEPVLPREAWFYNGVPKEGTAISRPFVTRGTPILVTYFATDFALETFGAYKLRQYDHPKWARAFEIFNIADHTGGIIVCKKLGH